MGRPRKKIYRAGSPGFARQKIGTTLGQIKREIAASTWRSQARKSYRKLGVLG